MHIQSSVYSFWFMDLLKFNHVPLTNIIQALYLVNSISTKYMASTQILVVSTTHELWCPPSFAFPIQCFWSLLLHILILLFPQGPAKIPHSSKIFVQLIVLSPNSIIHSLYIGELLCARPSSKSWGCRNKQDPVSVLKHSAGLPKRHIKHILGTHTHGVKIIWKNKIF